MMTDIADALNYSGKNILAPMVRIGRLPTRLLALRYGADIVYSEEIIDHRFVNCRRFENDKLKTVDFILEEDHRPMFRTCKREKNNVVLQLGTANGERALKAAKLVENDVAGIDVNMGCPKEYSTKGGMGAALLERPDAIKSILTTLVRSLSIPVTCKIRVLPDLNRTLDLVKMIASTGVAALAVHGRLKAERPRHPVRADVIRAIKEAVDIPVIANGGSEEFITSFEDIEKFRAATNADSVMIARAAQHNCSVFRREGLLPVDKVIEDYLHLAVEFDNHYINTKYCLLEIMKDCQETTRGRALRSSESLQEICEIFDMKDCYNEFFRKRKLEDSNGTHPVAKRSNKDDVITMDFQFKRCDFNLKLKSPKTILVEWTRKTSVKPPSYETECRVTDRRFRSVLSVDGVKYQTTYWERNKRLAEQSAAVVCLRSLGVYDGTKTEVKSTSET